MKAYYDNGIVGYSFIVGDLLHLGHLHFLQECKKHCDFLIVGVYTDELTASYKRKPIIPFKERIEMIRALRCVDLVVKVEHRCCVPILRKLTEDGWRISVLFHGTDWDAKKDPDLFRSKEYIESIGGKLIQPEYYLYQSTSKIIATIVKRHTGYEHPINPQKEG